VEQRFLIVRVGEHRIALPEPSLVEVARAVALTSVPSTSRDLVAGVCNLRGKVTVVLDLRGRFGEPTLPPRPSDALVFLVAHGRTVGLLVDHIDDFVPIDVERLRPASAVSAALGDRTRMAETADGVLVVVDVASFVAESELDAVEAAGASP